MLSDSSKPYIEASVPVLREHGLTISTVFYRNLFLEYPDLKNLFNMGNQAQGIQQKSLAAAVFAYAANISNPEVLKPVISRIVNKHVSLGILPEHYPIVGRHLLGAIKEVLGDAATVPLIAAWTEAYGLLADALIGYEKEFYDRSPVAPGYLTKLKVTGIKQQSKLVRSFELTSMDGIPLTKFKPGQYVSVAVNFDDGSRQLRQYSLSDPPSKSHYRISVKREAYGMEDIQGQVSNWLHDNLQMGDAVLVGQPSGDFIPEAKLDETIVLISGGIGITPMVSTLKHLEEVDPLRHVIFAHSVSSKEHHSHAEEVAAAKAMMPNLRVITFYGEMSDEQRESGLNLKGRMDVNQIPGIEDKNSKFYLCGPLPFMESVRIQLQKKGILAHRIYKEVFGPDLLADLV